MDKQTTDQTTYQLFQKGKEPETFTDCGFHAIRTLSPR
ncbi:hypothetical protein PshuTeo1_58240 (plasmid) [Pseudomonas hunanensis]|nr:hypothetical protein PshuTeo1_58240 [Pseudomonas hunanensis]